MANGRRHGNRDSYYRLPRNAPSERFVAHAGDRSTITQFEPEHPEARAIDLDPSAGGVHQGAQPPCCRPGAVYMAATDQLPDPNKTLASREPSIHGSSTIADATHKTLEVRAWLDKYPRSKLHFSPTSASPLNLVEHFFAEITSRRIRRGSYSSVHDLKAAIYDYLAQHNAKPKHFTWTKSAEYLLARERRTLKALDEIRGNRAGVRHETLCREKIHSPVEAIHFVIPIFAHGCVFNRHTTETRAMYFETPDDLVAAIEAFESARARNSGAAMREIAARRYTRKVAGCAYFRLLKSRWKWKKP